MNFRRVWDLLSTEKAATAAGFAVGFYGGFNPARAFNNYPLSEILGGIICGSICSWGASFLHGLMPKNFAPVIPTVSTIYCVNLLAKDILGFSRIGRIIVISIEKN